MRGRNQTSRNKHRTDGSGQRLTILGVPSEIPGSLTDKESDKLKQYNFLQKICEQLQISMQAADTSSSDQNLFNSGKLNKADEFLKFPRDRESTTPSIPKSSLRVQPADITPMSTSPEPLLSDEVYSDEIPDDLSDSQFPDSSQ